MIVLENKMDEIDIKIVDCYYKNYVNDKLNDKCKNCLNLKECDYLYSENLYQSLFDD